jgi:ABC-type transport system substrate-binding protein
MMLLAALMTSAVAQKYGGTLRFPLRENPSSASLHEESSITAMQPFMAVFNNLVVYDQQQEMARPESIKPDLATEWSWSADHKVLTMKLRQGVKWHDGKPFTSTDVQCTWDMILEKRTSNWRKNSHKEWYGNLKEVVVTGPYEVRFVLGRPQPSFLSFLANGWSPVYPCHVDGRVMRQKPIGTGPFKVEEFKPNDVIRLVKNTDYWKPGRPYLDGIVFRIMPSTATRVLSFMAGEFDMTGTSTVLPHTIKDVHAKVPKALCQTTGTMVTGVVLINHKAPPFDNPKVRQAVNLALDRNVEAKDYTVYTGAVIKGAYTISFETSGAAIDDPDVVLYEGFKCESIRNYNKYCNREVEAKIDEQSATVDPVKRKQLVQALDLQLLQEHARLAVYHSTSAACWLPHVKGYLRSKNGIYTHHRMEDVWMDK